MPTLVVEGAHIKKYKFYNGILEAVKLGGMNWNLGDVCPMIGLQVLTLEIFLMNISIFLLVKIS